MSDQRVFLIWREWWQDKPKPTPLVRNVWCYGDPASALTMAAHVTANRYGDNPEHKPGLIYTALEGQPASAWKLVQL